MNIPTIFGRLTTALLALVFAATAAAAQPGPPPGSTPGSTPGGALGGPPGGLPPASGPLLPRVLVWADVQTGFHHDSINRAMAAIEELGRESGLWTTYLRTDSQLITRQPIVGQGSRYTGRYINAHNLNDFDAIFFLGSGEGTLSNTQKADLLAFVREDGKGFVGGHASTIAFYDWPEYGEMLGGFQSGEYRVEPHKLIKEDADFPGVKDFPAVFPEQYQFLNDSYKANDIHVLLRLDPRDLTPEQLARRPDGDLPVVWTRNYGKGRVYVSTFGHLDSVWDDPSVRKLYFEGIKWALGPALARSATRTPSATPAP